jgi:hypothetical protein
MDFDQFNWKSLDPGKNVYVTIINKKIKSYYNNWSLASYFRFAENKIKIYLNIDERSVNCDNHLKIINYCKINNYQLVQKITRVSCSNTSSIN